jgi:hypothetical protein
VTDWASAAVKQATQVVVGTDGQEGRPLPSKLDLQMSSEPSHLLMRVAIQTAIDLMKAPVSTLQTPRDALVEFD